MKTPHAAIVPSTKLHPCLFVVIREGTSLTYPMLRHDVILINNTSGLIVYIQNDRAAGRMHSRDLLPTCEERCCRGKTERRSKEDRINHKTADDLEASCLDGCFGNQHSNFDAKAKSRAWTLVIHPSDLFKGSLNEAFFCLSGSSMVLTL